MGKSVFILKKILNLVITLFIVSIVLQVLLYILPGDPLEAKLGADYLDDPSSANYYIDLYNLDKNIFQRYFIWLKDFVFGDWGLSFTYTNSSVKSIIFGSRLVTTLSLAVLSIITTVSVSVLYSLKMYNSYQKKGVFYKFSDFINQIFLALPSFWIGIILLTVFGLVLGVFPVSTGIVDWSNPSFTIKSLVLPVITLSIGSIAYVSRYLVNILKGEQKKDYVLVAKTLGYSDESITKKYIFKNSLVPLITLFSLIFMSVITGSVVVENLFSLAGMGRLLVDAIGAKDYPLIQGIVMLYTIFVVLITFVTEIIYYFIDTRIEVEND